MNLITLLFVIFTSIFPAENLKTGTEIKLRNENISSKKGEAVFSICTEDQFSISKSKLTTSAKC